MSIHIFCSTRQYMTLYVVMLCIVMLTNSQSAVLAAAGDDYSIQVTVEQVTAQDNIDPGCGEADFYAFITINGSTYQTPIIDDDDDIQPNWSHAVQVAAGADVPVQIALWDEDNFLCGSDDHVDIRNTNGRDLNLTVNLTSCTVNGDLSGTCETSLISAGTENDRARIQLRVDVSAPVQSYSVYLPILVK